MGRRSSAKIGPVLGFLVGAPILMILPTIFGMLKVVGWFVVVCGGLSLAMAGFIWAIGPAQDRSRNQRTKKAIGQSLPLCVTDSASLNGGGNMAYDTRFALIDRQGDARFAALIDGTFQIGKDRRSRPTGIEDFARAILIDGEDGRFVCADGRKPAVLKFSGRATEARSYRLDPAVAAKLGIPASGKR